MLDTLSLGAYMKKLNGLDIFLIVILIIGGVNWGLVGVAHFDLVAFLFGPFSIVARVIYTLVGLSALYVLGLLFSKLRAHRV